ncbi:MAG: 7-carboxy-7-deazaguanine synthase QueE [Bacteroidales bacterium]|jgi:organic radical activating enzyme|nr:7-carboxy-7-deazaguanine synthase QueE [Bacteroidales bacterium]
MNNEFLPVLEEFYSLQGEGYNTGKAAYFIRIGGCDVGCDFCDSKQSWNISHIEPTKIDDIIRRIETLPTKNAVVTGGEPLLYNLDYLTKRLHEKGITVFLETSGTSKFSGQWDWICLSAKKNIKPLDENIKLADELKIIICDEDDFAFAEYYAKKVRMDCLLYLQPEWSVKDKVMNNIVEYIKQNPQWCISLQSHKYMNIP